MLILTEGPRLLGVRGNANFTDSPNVLYAYIGGSLCGNRRDQMVNNENGGKRWRGEEISIAVLLRAD